MSGKRLEFYVSSNRLTRHSNIDQSQHPKW